MKFKKNLIILQLNKMLKMILNKKDLKLKM